LAEIEGETREGEIAYIGVKKSNSEQVPASVSSSLGTQSKKIALSDKEFGKY
jgi:hypothetical protein